jgi:predicted metal-dependent phosphoesterase TrpH
MPLMAERFDLHVHSTASDGTYTPTELVREAKRKRLTAIALTDHDTVEGIAEARREGEVLGIEVLAGIELSVVEDDGARQMHILGLGTEPTPSLVERLEVLSRERRERGLRMVERLRDLGIDLPDEVVLEIAGHSSVGRPHVAQSLVKIGICKTQQEAFDRFIGRTGPAYVGRRALTAREAIDLIHSAGGIASLAHPPLSVGVDGAGGLSRFVSEPVRLGLDGIEIQHPSHSPKQRRKLRQLAREHGLIETGGSDFHGDHKPEVQLGRGRGNVQVGPEVFEAVVDAIRARREGRPESVDPVS